MIGAVVRVLLPEGVVAALNPKRDMYRGEMIDPKAFAVGRLVALMRPAGEVPDVAEGRQMLRDVAGKFDVKVDIARIEDITLDGAAGPVRARLFSDHTDTEPRPAMVYYHGGGFVQGDLDSHNHTCAKLAKFWGGVVISVDYRLAPEHPFPAGPEDCEAAFLSVVERAEELGVDPENLGVGGDSAGGCLAAVVAQQRVAKGGAKPAFQVLIYPVVDATLSSPSVKDLADAYVLPSSLLFWFRDTYAGGWTDFEDPRFSPMFGAAEGLPDTYILTGGFDPLMDEGKAYGEKLQAAGVDVTHRRFPGEIHGFVSLTKVIPQGMQALEEIADWLKGR